MLTFITEEFENELKDCLRYVNEKQKGSHGLGIDFYDILDEDFDHEGYEDIVIDENHIITIDPDYSEVDSELTLKEFISIINEAKSARLIEKVKCISDNNVIIRVSPALQKDFEIIDLLFDTKKKIFEIESFVDGVTLSLSLKRGITTFGIMVNFSNDFDKYFPSIMFEDLFIEIVKDGIIDDTYTDIITNSYLFELYATQGIKLYRNPRLTADSEGINEDDVLDNHSILRPLLLGKGINDVIKLFNDAEDGFNNYDYSIIQYTKVIEYVSQTVVRHEITSNAQRKLLSTRALRPDANYVKELENMFSEFKHKYETDRNAIKTTIKACCDILEVADIAPKYLNKVVNLNETLSKEKADKEKIVDAAYDILADSISDTRNYIAHAKANYTPKGQECPEYQKSDFVTMLRVISIQVIRWFSMVNEGNRIVSE